jgi:hypothetical protein
MRPLPDLPHRDDEPDGNADMVIWCLAFLTLGSLIIANLPDRSVGIWLGIAVLSFSVGIWFLFRLIVRRG